MSADWRISGPGRYRKIATVEAMQISAEGSEDESVVSQNSLSVAAISGWMTGSGFRDFMVKEFTVDGVRLFGLTILTLEGEMDAVPGSWICKGAEGEFWPIKESIFAKTYAMAEDD